MKLSSIVLASSFCLLTACSSTEKNTAPPPLALTQSNTFTQAPVETQQEIFALSERGTTYVIEAGPEFRVIGENELDEFTMATPAVLNDSLIIRTSEAVYRIANQ